MNRILIDEESINQLYDTYLVQYALSFSDVWMMNWGYWKEDTLDVSTSQIDLIKKMMEGTKLENKNVLDVGCGVGGTAIFIQKFFSTKSIIGVNISAQQIQMANKLAIQENCSDNIQFKVANASQLPFKKQTFDVIIVIECAFHFVRKDLFIQEAYRVMKPGGKLIIADINLTENSNLVDKYENKLIEFYEGLQIPDLAKISDWNYLFENNKFSKASVEDITEYSAISLNQIIKNSTNPKIFRIQEKLNNFNHNNTFINRKWNNDWYMLLGNLSYNGVISYNIISTRK